MQASRKVPGSTESASGFIWVKLDKTAVCMLRECDCRKRYLPTPASAMLRKTLVMLSAPPSER